MITTQKNKRLKSLTFSNLLNIMAAELKSLVEQGKIDRRLADYILRNPMVYAEIYMPPQYLEKTNLFLIQLSNEGTIPENAEITTFYPHAPFPSSAKYSIKDFENLVLNVGHIGQQVARVCPTIPSAYVVPLGQRKEIERIKLPD